MPAMQVWLAVLGLQARQMWRSTCLVSLLNLFLTIWLRTGQGGLAFSLFRECEMYEVLSFA